MSYPYKNEIEHGHERRGKSDAALNMFRGGLDTFEIGRNMAITEALAHQLISEARQRQRTAK